MAETPLPSSNWGITTPDRLLSNLRVAETGGDIAECADALEWMLRSGRLVDREAIDYEAMSEAVIALRKKPWGHSVDDGMTILDAALGMSDG